MKASLVKSLKDNSFIINFESKEKKVKKLMVLESVTLLVVVQFMKGGRSIGGLWLYWWVDFLGRPEVGPGVEGGTSSRLG